MEFQEENALADNFKRLVTFQEYPIEEAEGSNRSSLVGYNSPINLAKAGFYRYTGCIGDEVRCYKCAVMYRGWNGETALSVHRILNPNCPVVVSQTPRRLTDVASHGSRSRVRRRLSLTAPNVDEASDDTNSNHRSVQDVLDEFGSADLNSDQQSTEDWDGGSLLFESHRLLTFPSPTHSRAEMWAEEGFVYHEGVVSEEGVVSMEGGVVRCVFCGLEIPYNTEHPSRTHKLESRDCPIVNHLEKCVGNISRVMEEKVRSQYHQLTSGNTLGTDSESASLFKHPQFEDFNYRLDTFKYWPRQLRPTADQLCEAGFYFSGYSDKVICFACGSGLRSWDPEADPWVQHALHASYCAFVKQHKGDNFISRAQEAQVQTDCDPPSDNDSSNPSSPCSALRPSLDVSAVEAALSCQYDVQQIRHAVLKFFLSSRGYYPNEKLLLGTLRAMDDNFSQIQRQREQIFNNHQQLNQRDQQLNQRDQVIEKVNQQLERNHEALEERETTIEREQRERERREREVRELRMRLNQERYRAETHVQRLQSQGQRLQSCLTQLQDREHLLEDKDSELERKQREMERQGEEFRRKDEEVRRQAEEVRRQAEEVRRKDEENRRLMEEMEKMRQLLQANNINYNIPAADAANVAAPVQQLPTPDVNRSSYPRCTVCLEEEARCQLRPCRHMCCGTQCAPKFIGGKCPICRDSVRDWEIIYVA